MGLRFINKTFGTLTEIDDFQQTLMRNVKFEQQQRICITPNNCITVQPGQSLQEIPPEFRAQVLAQLDTEAAGNLDVDFQGFIEDFSKMELMDSMIGVAMQAERGAINAAGIRGITDYGNISTWLNRANKLTDVITGARDVQTP